MAGAYGREEAGRAGIDVTKTFDYKAKEFVFYLENH